MFFGEFGSFDFTSFFYTLFPFLRSTPSRRILWATSNGRTTAPFGISTPSSSWLWKLSSHWSTWRLPTSLSTSGKLSPRSTGIRARRLPRKWRSTTSPTTKAWSSTSCGTSGSSCSYKSYAQWTSYQRRYHFKSNIYSAADNHLMISFF